VSEPFDAEDRDAQRALAALGLLGEHEAEQGTRPGDEASEARVRLHTEVLGLLPYAVDRPAAPAALRARILSTIAGEETMAVSGQARRPPSGARPAMVAPPPFRSSIGPAPPRASRWPMALAATIAVACLGLAGWLFVQLDEQRAQSARLQTQMRQLSERQAELEAMQGQLTALRRNVGMMTAPGVLACGLRPESIGSPQPAAKGLLFVAADHQHWYLSLRSLAPAPPGQAYQLWWDADAGMVSGGTFAVEPGKNVELSSETMPRGTSGVVITLEPAGGSPQPRGPQILTGNQMQQLL
jgi:hypothetical protein